MTYHPHHQHFAAAVIASLWRVRHKSAEHREMLKTALATEKRRRNAARDRAKKRAVTA